MAFTLYTSEDADAPVLEDAAGSLLNILRKCLVQGYGDQSPAGWAEQINADNVRGAFQSQDPASPQHWFYIDDSKTGSITTVAYARAAFDFNGWDGSDEPDFVDPYPTVAQEADGLVFHKSHTDTGGNEWAVIADGRTCWWASTPRGATPMTNWTTGAFDLFVQLQGFGDTVSELNHPSPCFIAGGREDSSPINSATILDDDGKTDSATALNDHFYLPGNYDLSSLSILAGAFVRSGGIAIGPRTGDVPVILTRPRHYFGGQRVERLRGLQDAWCVLNTQAEYEAVFGLPDAGNPGLLTIGTGEGERLFIINGRIDTSNENALIAFNLNDE